MDDTDVRYTDVAGVPIAYHVVGQGPAVLFTHGYTASSHMFAKNAEVLAAEYTVISWDIRGHGSSGSPDAAGAYTADLAITDMASVLDAAGVDRAVVAGHSLGGYLSLGFHLAHRDRVRGLILIDTGPGYRNDEAREGWNQMARGYAEQFEQRGFDGYSGGDEFSPAVHRGGPAGLARAARGILTQNDSRVIDSLPTIDVPTLVIVGGQDQPFLGGSRYMAGKIPGATLAVIEGAGHSPNVTHPAEFDAAVREFLQRIDGDDG